ncbi:succinate--hydroxymethylglutarate CoA-transferase [Culicoides brevitarsis]|uniref:succinate--hydroxymethylglutarate CoA-transferase n=1 Tax=Culicoides brevitarsis TaxID=469753 RepID=UPI00307B64DB
MREIAKKIASNARNFCSKVDFSTCEAKIHPLKGVRVLDLTRIIAGPFCTMILGDLGADVIKVEKPGVGDESRKWGPPFLPNSTDSVYFLASNRNKRSICVDMKRGKEILHELVRHSDVLVENYVPGKLKKFHLDYESLRKINPSLIYCSITGYGDEGPYASRPGYDVIAASVGGLLDITGPEDGAPCKVGVAMTDLATGLYAHGAILAAILHRNATGMGQKIDANLLSTQVASLINVGSNFLNAGKEARRWGTAHESIVPYEAFKTSSGYLTVGTGSDSQFKSLCKLMKVENLAADEKYLTNKDRVANRKSLIEALSKKFSEKSNKEWMEIFHDAPFPVGPINSVKEVFEDEHVKAINLVKNVKHSKAGNVKVVGPPVKYSNIRNDVRTAPPALGEHTEEVLTEILGYKKDKIEELKTQGIVQ